MPPVLEPEAISESWINILGFMILKLQACLQVVEHVGDSTREGEHDDKEGDEEHPNVLHHGVDTENDRAEVLGGDPDLDHLDDGQGERHPP